MRLHRKRDAFTMIELVMVITILGIVSSIGAEIISKVYENYIIQRAQHRATVKTELIALQISNRLSSAILRTLGQRADKTSTFNLLSSGLGLSTDKVLQWVGEDREGFNEGGWTGFCDLDSPNTNKATGTIFSPDSNFNAIEETILSNLFTLSNPRIFFPSDSASYTVQPGYTTDTLSITPIPTFIAEQYKIGASSYALEVDSSKNLILHYDFVADVGTAITGNKSSILARNIDVFKFIIEGSTIRFKVCVQESISEGFKISACKEKVVF